MTVIYCNEDFYPELYMRSYNIAFHDHSILMSVFYLNHQR